MFNHNNSFLKKNNKNNLFFLISTSILFFVLFSLVFPLLIPAASAFDQTDSDLMKIDEFDKTFPKTDSPTLHSEKIYVYINDDGSADIVSFRKCTMTSGTENFIQINNLGKSEISNFRVSEYGKVYEKSNEWDISAEFDEKAYKSGIVETETGYELCWGISEYGNHNYKISYHVSNFVKETKDSQIIFWQFINHGTNIPPETATVTISAPWDFDYKDSRIWAFGYEGTINFVDGKIVAKSTVPFLDKDYLTILSDFPKLTETNDILDKTTDEIIKQAFIGSDYKYSDINSISSITKNIKLNADKTASFDEKYTTVLNKPAIIEIPIIANEITDISNVKILETKNNQTYQITDYEINHLKKERYDIIFTASEGVSEYDVSYDVKNVVKSAQDGQFVEYYLYKPLDIEARSVTTNLEFPESVMASTIKTSSYSDILTQNKIKIIRNKYPFHTKEYAESYTDLMYCMVYLAGEPFETENVVSKSRDSFFYDRAKQFADENISLFDKIIDSILIFGSYLILFVLIPITIIYLVAINLIKRSKKKKYKSKQIEKGCKGEYIRTIPYDGEVTDIFYLTSVLSDYTSSSTYISYCFLKWISEGRLEIEKSFEKGILKTEEVTNFKLTGKGEYSKNEITNPHEKRLFKIISSIEKDGILYKKDIERIGRTKYSLFGTFIDKLKNDTEKVAENLNLIGSTYAFKKHHYIEIPSEKGFEILKNIQKFKNFLLDFSLLSEREETAVYMWGEYMQWASYLGISEKVLMEMKAIKEVTSTPTYINNMNVADIIMISAIGSSAISSYNSEFNSRNYSSSSSGGGGFSSGGGGGGSFGGGGGGGYR